MKKALHLTEGTVAHVFYTSMHTLDLTSLPKAKSQVISLLQSPEIKDKALATQYISDIQRVHNLSHLLSILTTYLSGIRVG